MEVADDFRGEERQKLKSISCINCVFSSSQSLHQPNICEVRSPCKGETKKKRKWGNMFWKTNDVEVSHEVSHMHLITAGAAVSLLQQSHTGVWFRSVVLSLLFCCLFDKLLQTNDSPLSGNVPCSYTQEHWFLFVFLNAKIKGPMCLAVDLWIICKCFLTNWLSD